MAENLEKAVHVGDVAMEACAMLRDRLRDLYDFISAPNVRTEPLMYGTGIQRNIETVMLAARAARNAARACHNVLKAIIEILPVPADSWGADDTSMIRLIGEAGALLDDAVKSVDTAIGSVVGEMPRLPAELAPIPAQGIPPMNFLPVMATPPAQNVFRAGPMWLPGMGETRIRKAVRDVTEAQLALDEARAQFYVVFARLDGFVTVDVNTCLHSAQEAQRSARTGLSFTAVNAPVVLPVVVRMEDDAEAEDALHHA